MVSRAARGRAGCVGCASRVGALRPAARAEDAHGAGGAGPAAGLAVATGVVAVRHLGPRLAGEPLRRRRAGPGRAPVAVRRGAGARARGRRCRRSSWGCVPALALGSTTRSPSISGRSAGLGLGARGDRRRPRLADAPRGAGCSPRCGRDRACCAPASGSPRDGDGRRADPHARPGQLRGPRLARRHRVRAPALTHAPRCGRAPARALDAADRLGVAAARRRRRDPALAGARVRDLLAHRAGQARRPPRHARAASRRRSSAALSKLPDPARKLASRPARSTAAPTTATPSGACRSPRIGLSTVFVAGTDAGDLRKGPGHYPARRCPGQRGTVASPGTARPTARRSASSTSSARGDEIGSRCPTGASPTGSSARGSCRRPRLGHQPRVLRPARPLRLPPAVLGGAAHRRLRAAHRDRAPRRRGVSWGGDPIDLWPREDDEAHMRSTNPIHEASPDAGPARDGGRRFGRSFPSLPPRMAR